MGAPEGSHTHTQTHAHNIYIHRNIQTAKHTKAGPLAEVSHSVDGCSKKKRRWTGRKGKRIATGCDLKNLSKFKSTEEMCALLFYYY